PDTRTVTPAHADANPDAHAHDAGLLGAGGRRPPGRGPRGIGWPGPAGRSSGAERPQLDDFTGPGRREPGLRPGATRRRPGDPRQLQENLIPLGFADPTASGTFDAATTAAVKSWQHGLGRAETGIVAFGDVVFLSGAIRVATHSVSTGDTVNAGAAVLTATSTDRVVSVDLAADEQSLVSVGDAVDVELPDGSHATAKVK